MIRFLLVLLLLASCAPRGHVTLMPAAAGVGRVQSVFVGTTRAMDATLGEFGRGRSETPSFARYDISIPPTHKLGQITWPARGFTPNPRRDFLTTGEVRFTSAQDYTAAVHQRLMQLPRGQRDVVIFVHGFNNTFAEGVYRIAQLSNDLELPGVTLHYSWPSRGNALGYVHDRDSALFARDGLEQMIAEANRAGADHVFLVAHSMGGALTMEAMRQIAIRGNARLMAKISGVVLISPDIDVDVFRMQAHAIGKLPDPFLIFGSDRDKLLKLSARLTGEPERLGNLSDVSRLADLKVTYLDTAAYAQGAGHFSLGDSPALLQLMSRISDVNAAFDFDRTSRVGLLPGVVLTVRNATEIVLAPIAAVSDELNR